MDDDGTSVNIDNDTRVVSQKQTLNKIFVHR